MVDTLIDLFNGIIKYGEDKIMVIVDDKDNPWFLANTVAKILGYTERDKAVRMHTNTNDRKKFNKLKKFAKNIPAYTKSHTIFINESGLYSLVMHSKLPSAEAFQRWVTSEVLPSIRKTGMYKVDDKHQKQLKELNEKLREAKREIRILKNNQKKKGYKATGMIYVVRLIDSSDKNLMKLGKTTNFNERLRTYNTSISDDMEILFTMEVDDPDAVEHCIKGSMHKFIYRRNKEYYRCTFSKIQETIIKCDKFIHDGFYCEKCQSRITSMDHFYNKHSFDNNELLLLDIVTEQEQQGGTNDFMELTTITVNDPLIFDKYCQVNLEPFIDRTNKTYHRCCIGNIKDLLEKCNENADIDNQIGELIVNHGLTLDDEIIIDVPIEEQKGGYTHIPSDEFTKGIIASEKGCVLPNGVIVYPNGKIVCPDDKIKQTGGTTKPIGSISQSKTYQWLNA